MELMNDTALSFWEEKFKTTSFLKRLFFKKKKSDKLCPPAIIQEQCEGILLNNTLVKSILFSTDLALIENSDCDAILAVYPFAPSSKIMETLIRFSNKPVICGVGGGKTQGKKSIAMAVEAERLGACAVIVNQPFKNRDIQEMKKHIAIPVISSVSTTAFDFEKRIASGISVFNISGGTNTHEIMQFLNKNHPHIPYICTGGKSLAHITKAVENNARAIVLTPPSNANLFKRIMKSYRENIKSTYK